MKKRKFYIAGTVVTLLILYHADPSHAQRMWTTHTRGKLWETLRNYGFIGDPGAWDYMQVTGIGFYPGFSGFMFPSHEEYANDPEKVTDANFHNFRSGPWIIAKDAQTLVAPDYHAEVQDYLVYAASIAGSNYDNGYLVNNPSFETYRNFVGSEEFDPLLPEEMNYCSFHTATGVTVYQTSMAWSFEGYHDFIIYDFIFKNTGEIAFPSLATTKHLDQTLNEVWIVFHSGLSVSTKGHLNFFYNPADFLKSPAPAGGFGWHPDEGYSDYYAVENQGNDGKGLLFYSRDNNGGREPQPTINIPIKPNWEQLLTLDQEWYPELQDPACFGFVFLYRTPPPGSNMDPFDADPTHFNVYTDQGDSFNGISLDMNENFKLRTFSKNYLYQFATHDYLPENNGDMYCWYTGSFGPYTLAPGDSVRLIIAEVAGVMDLMEVAKGDPNYYYPDSSIAAIRRNADAARRALRWGIGSNVEGVEIAADVPEAPPAPNCLAVNISAGMDTAKIAIRWDKLAEETTITDGSGNIFYDGSTDLSGYRIYRGKFGNYHYWELLLDISRDNFDDYWNEENLSYEYIDMDLDFGFEFYYYVESYNSHPRIWTSANGTVVENLGELRSDDYNITNRVGAKPGPVSLDLGWDVFAVPNPYVAGDFNRSFGEPTPYKIEFRNLPERATIKIFSLSGDLLKTIKHGPDEIGNLFGSTSWDQRTESGLLVAPGLYIYVVESETEGYQGQQYTGKLMIIR